MPAIIAQPNVYTGLFDHLLTFLSTQNFKPLLPTHVTEEANKSVVEPFVNRNSVSDSFEYGLLQLHEPVPKLKTGYTLNLTGFMESETQLSSSRSIVTARTEKEQKIDKYAETISEITDFIFLSGIKPAHSLKELANNRITYVLSLCGDLCATPVDPSLNNFVICLKDSSRECVEAVIYMCFRFIHDARTRGERVLVHCQQGISRSSCIVIAYLMMSNDLTYKEAYGHVRAKRPVISPNPGFIFQLCDWWRKRHCCIFHQEICLQIRERFAVSGIIPLDEATVYDSAVRDLNGCHFVQCVKSNERDAHPRVYRLSVFTSTEDIWVLRNVETKLIGQSKQYFFDPRFVYVVTSLVLGTVVVVGEEAARLMGGDASERVKRSKSDVVASECQSNAINCENRLENGERTDSMKHFSEVELQLKNLHANNESYFNPVDPDEFFRTHGHLEQMEDIYEQLELAGLRTDIRQNLSLSLAEMEFFQQISANLLILHQRAISNLLQTYYESKQCSPDLSKLIYLLGKLSILKEQRHIKDDYMETECVTEEGQKSQQIMRLNPAAAKWQIDSIISEKDLMDCVIFSETEELNGEFELVKSKITAEQ